MQNVALTVHGNEHRYVLFLDPDDCDRVRRWLVQQALGNLDSTASWKSEVQALRELADLIERQAGQ